MGDDRISDIWLGSDGETFGELTTGALTPIGNCTPGNCTLGADGPTTGALILLGNCTPVIAHLVIAHLVQIVRLMGLWYSLVIAHSVIAHSVVVHLVIVHLVIVHLVIAHLGLGSGIEFIGATWSLRPVFDWAFGELIVVVSSQFWVQMLARWNNRYQWWGQAWDTTGTLQERFQDSRDGQRSYRGYIRYRRSSYGHRKMNVDIRLRIYIPGIFLIIVFMRFIFAPSLLHIFIILLSLRCMSSLCIRFG